MVDVKDDLEQQLKDAHNLIEELKEQKANLQNELDNAGDYILDQEERVNKIRDYFGLQLKTLKQDQEKTYLENSEHKSFDMMDKLFRLTQERNRALEDRMVSIEQDSINWTVKKV